MRGGPVSGDRLLPEIPTISPSALDDWERCPRLYLDRHLLRLPPSDTGSSSEVGNLVHDLLRLLHGQGDCHDAELRRATLENHGQSGDGAIGAMLARHADRCPAPARAHGHEVEVVRVSRTGPVWIGTGRLDAVWEHDGILDVRDYKTGARATATSARTPGRGCRRGSPHRSHRDSRSGCATSTSATTAIPSSSSPTPRTSRQIEQDVTAVIDAIRHAAGRDEFPGVADVETCRTCSFRSICPDSAVAGTPTWPVPTHPS